MIPVLATFVMMLPSCQKEVDFNTTDDDMVTGDFRVKIDGVQWIANKAAIATRT